MRNTLIIIFQLAIAVILLPTVIGASTGFIRELGKASDLPGLFFWGITAYVLMHLFVYQPKGMFRLTQQTSKDILRFFPAGAEIVPRFIPLWTTTLLIVLYIVRHFNSSAVMTNYFVFFAAYLLALHVILTAQELYEQDGSSLKSHYFYLMSAVYIVNLVIVAGLLDLNFKEFVLAGFIKSSSTVAKQIYSGVTGQFFSL